MMNSLGAATATTPAMETVARDRWLLLAGVLLLFPILVETGAFISLPLILTNLPPGALRDTDNPVYSLSIAASMAIMVVLCATRLRLILHILRQTPAATAYLLIVLASFLWSAHPDLSLRRGFGYLLTVSVALFLTTRFPLRARLEILSAAFSIAAFASVLFCLVLPQYGVMHTSGLEGDWRGVFAHKNVLGPVMCTALFIELALVAGRPGGATLLRLVNIVLFGGLIVMSHSVSAAAVGAIYVGGYFLYRLGRGSRAGFALASIAGIGIGLAAFAAIALDPQGVFEFFGKDAGLTGRTGLWDEVMALIAERPLLGWGFHATWVVDDTLTSVIDYRTGSWGVTNAQNSFLEIALQLGLVGLAAIVLTIVGAIRAAIICLRTGAIWLGHFALLLFGGLLLIGQVEITVGQNQIVTWLVFNVMMFAVVDAAREANRAKRK
jgi:O-antigen ligase